MMKIFIHRVNQSSDLLQIPANFGVEIDIRTSGKDLILSHDPFSYGELFTDWLKSWKGQSLILNVLSIINEVKKFLRQRKLCYFHILVHHQK